MGTGDLNPCIMGLLARLGFNGSEVCKCNAWPVAPDISCVMWVIKVNNVVSLIQVINSLLTTCNSIPNCLILSHDQSSMFQNIVNRVLYA
jgi:hypothetical protein